MQLLVGFLWLVAAIIQSTSHICTLSVYQHNKKQTIVGIKEQHVTGILIHVLIEMRILIKLTRQLLKSIP